ncbi:poly-gamma-glutamate hydrolase family protein [Rhizobium sp. B21/90]|uniref:poly-gamma-glutamate hydrolase family protein n=1 Tax=Rhizobium sp. B21/90 TaxID=2819993 RepID=UPI001C5BAA17|nr:poly-gamma-glutamate hydrolase family protein [Rhizobium sp. B21/90]
MIAPHGGKVERGTSELALAVAGTRLSYYLFEDLKPKGNRDLHVTSSSFNETQALAVVESSNTCRQISPPVAIPVCSARPPRPGWVAFSTRFLIG